MGARVGHSDDKSPGTVEPPSKARVLVLGATGTIGRATVQKLVADGHEVVAYVRQRAPRAGAHGDGLAELTGASLRNGAVDSAEAILDHAIAGERFEAVISCLASRTGAPNDAWAIDHRAHVNALNAAKSSGISKFVLVSALCVQRPQLAFQSAKLAFEAELIASGLTYAIVRPTAYFKSLLGQIERVKQGKPFLVFGDGQLTRCKPISDHDLAAYVVGCLHDQSRHNRILPIGGPDPAFTPLQQAERLFDVLGRPMRVRHVPVALIDGIVAGLSLARQVVPSLGDKAELARIGRYYATQSMVHFDAVAGRYDAGQTPSTGTQSFFAHQEAVVRGQIKVERGAHAVF